MLIIVKKTALSPHFSQIIITIIMVIITIIITSPQLARETRPAGPYPRLPSFSRRLSQLRPDWQLQSQWSGEKLMIKVWSICLNVSVCENLSRATLPCRSPLANSPSYVSLPDLSSQHDLINVLKPPGGNNLIRSSASCSWQKYESTLTYQL